MNFNTCSRLRRHLHPLFKLLSVREEEHRWRRLLHANNAKAQRADDDTRGYPALFREYAPARECRCFALALRRCTRLKLGGGVPFQVRPRAVR